MISCTQKNSSIGYFSRLAVPVLDRLLNYLDALGNNADHIARSKRGAAEYAAKSILTGAIADGRDIRPIMNLVWEKYSKGETTGLLKVLQKIYLLTDLAPEEPGQDFEKHLRTIVGQGDLSDEDKAHYVEVLYLGFLANCLRDARSADSALSRGEWYFFAKHVSQSMEQAAVATEKLHALRLPTRLNKLDFVHLAKIFRAMKYKSGRRNFGDDISPMQAFGIGGATRQESTDPYGQVIAYLVNVLGEETPLFQLDAH